MVVRLRPISCKERSAFDLSRSSNEPSLLPFLSSGKAMTTNHTSKAIERRIEDEFRYYWKSRRKRKLNFEEKRATRRRLLRVNARQMFRGWRRVNEIPSERPGGGTCCFEGNRKQNPRADASRQRWRLRVSGVWFQVG